METINGYEIVGQCRLPKQVGCKPARMIMVDRGNGYKERYVVSDHRYGENGWCNGQYFNHEREAREYFAIRVGRGF